MEQNSRSTNNCFPALDSTSRSLDIGKHILGWSLWSASVWLWAAYECRVFCKVQPWWLNATSFWSASVDRRIEVEKVARADKDCHFRSLYPVKDIWVLADIRQDHWQLAQAQIPD